MRLAGETNLIIVDEVGVGVVEDYRDEDISHLWLDETVLGNKMNYGISLACGDVIQKLDDDDYYDPEFLASSYENVTRHGENYLSVCGVFLSMIRGDSNLYYICGEGSWWAGGTMCFHRSVWEKERFPGVKCGVDYQFVKVHPELKMCYLVNPELYVLVRHDSNTWRSMRDSGNSVDEVIKGFPVYHKPLESFMSHQHAPFYTELGKKEVTLC